MQVCGVEYGRQCLCFFLFRPALVLLLSCSQSLNFTSNCGDKQDKQDNGLKTFLQRNFRFGFALFCPVLRFISILSQLGQDKSRTRAGQEQDKAGQAGQEFVGREVLGALDGRREWL